MKDSSRTPSQKVEDCEFLQDQKTIRKAKFALMLAKSSYEKKCAEKLKRKQRFLSKPMVHEGSFIESKENHTTSTNSTNSSSSSMIQL